MAGMERIWCRSAAAKLHGSDDHIRVSAIPYIDAGFPTGGSVA
jgi:hypothetical protein